MTRPFRDLAELRALLDALCEETITPEQVRRLEELVLTHPEAEALYVQYMGLYADLAGHFAAPAASPALPGPAPAPSVPRTVPFWRRKAVWGKAALVGVAAGLLLAVALWMRPGVVPPSPARLVEPEDNTVAVLLQAPGAEWEEDSMPARPGDPLPPGWLRLRAGFAHVEFYSGAVVILQGPAALELISQTEARIAHGRLRATVPPQAQGFTVGAPNLDLVDRGTEFGLEVGGDDQTEVHVFQGKVDLYKPGVPDVPRDELTTGQGVRVQGQGASQPIPPNPVAFPSARDLAERFEEQARRRQRAWEAASAALRKDPGLLVYYPFEPGQAWSRTLPDEARERQQPHDGAVVGCAWGPGRWPGKQGLEFRRVSDRVRLSVSGEYDSLTLAAWVRVDALPNVNNSLFMADGWEPGEVHWQIGSDGTLILGVQQSPKGRGAHYHAPGVFTGKRLGKWVHLAVVYDRDGGRVTHYVDGSPTTPLPLQFDIPLRIGDAQLGNWDIAAHNNKTPIRFLSGCMDEFLLFGRALGDDEVAALYEQGRPPF